ncbi:hypothetical protein ACFYRD_20565 [Streptomyces hirsutus]|uniref:hypothetical protein n=1 Tax=Streptomyces hirsutus TaxID=35620 RepID=UPI0036ACBB32
MIQLFINPTLQQERQITRPVFLSDKRTFGDTLLALRELFRGSRRPSRVKDVDPYALFERKFQKVHNINSPLPFTGEDERYCSNLLQDFLKVICRGVTVM